MFGKKKCSNCSKSLSKNFEFCPFCGESQRNVDSEEYGLLGKEDGDFKSLQPKSNGMLDGILKNFMSQAVKMIDSEIKNISKQEKTSNLGGFELFINGKKVNLPENLAGIQIGKMPIMPVQNPEKNNKQEMPKVSEETLKTSVKLPRKEAKSKVSRTSNSVIYELDTPGISSLNNVLINKLESNLEIKVFTEKTVYIKSIPIKLPLARYSISPQEGKLILEFKAQ